MQGAHSKSSALKVVNLVNKSRDPEILQVHLCFGENLTLLPRAENTPVDKRRAHTNTRLTTRALAFDTASGRETNVRRRAAPQSPRLPN